MLSIEQLTQAVLSLPSASRSKLAEELVQSLEFDVDPAIQTTWLNIAQQRRDEIRSGSVQAIDGQKALDRVRQLLE
ncbi:addiction module protein [Chamaesiphon sp. VAR_48_metabat_135_sub]|uniref:addiction module protein n=1 Tax=Chamaesiphon sp. VAR_48_metabat_135_sub TaxID=2964699 RepID=UPI00286B4C6E|nr:addiction module protein [Chamaesiphon sp. VAR_48_metabat_135_sub]